jgi:hypothetical protein
MYHTTSHDYVIQQAGFIQKGEFNTSIHNHLLQTAVLTQDSENYPQVQLGNPIKKISTGLINLVAKLIWKTERVYDNLAQAAR